MRELRYCVAHTLTGRYAYTGNLGLVMKFRKSDHIETPHGNSTVWRYMNTWKFEQLLSSGSIFFPNAVKLSDQYEVTVPNSVVEQKRKELVAKGLSGKDLEEEVGIFAWNANPMKELVLINCWSINPHENYALWKIYLGGEKNGVAIKSTVSKLRKSVISGKDSYPEEFFMGKVKYRKHMSSDELSRLSVITTKKPFYEFEKELRLFILNYPLSEGGSVTPYDFSIGREVRVDVNELVHEIYISPFADETYRQKIEMLLNKNKLSTDLLKQSEILDQ